ncbi:conserved Plasmodium protein, unknown function [Plasmodium ovale]|uniref:Uncharacterized protein n=1 Tax=Plasmodium ovale TaxID=36330 RepID=A0A1C3L5R6_PLAOA|nr:conserved Plasmodium protein, unknown function [Plasmodium ovale]
MSNPFLKRKKLTFVNVNLKSYFYKSATCRGSFYQGNLHRGSKNGKKKLHIYERKKQVDERIKLTSNLKYNEIIFLFRKNMNSEIKKRHLFFCNFLKSDIITLLKRDIEKLKKKQYNHFSTNNRKHSFKKMLSICMLTNDKNAVVNIAQRHILKTSLYHLFLVLKLSIDFKNLELLKLLTLEEFIKKIELLKSQERNGSEEIKKSRNFVLTRERIRDRKFFINPSSEQGDPSRNIYIFDIIHFVNEKVKGSSGVESLGKEKPLEHLEEVITSGKANELTEISNEHVHSNGKGKYANGGGKNDERVEVSGKDDLRWNKLGFKKDHGGRGSTNGETLSDRKRSGNMYGGGKRTDEISAEEIKFFSYNQRSNHLGVYKEIYERSAECRNIKFYENMKNPRVERLAVSRVIDKEELQNNRLKEDFIKCKHFMTNTTVEKQKNVNCLQATISSTYLLKECILSAFLTICVNNYEDKNYKYMKNIFFSNFYFYNPLFLFYYFPYILQNENKIYEKFLKEFIKFLNNIIIHFHFYLLPFFINLNYSTVFFNLFKKIINLRSDEDTINVFKKSNSHHFIKERICYTYKHFHDDKKNVTFLLFFFYEMFFLDSVIEKYRQIYVQNFYFYNSENEGKKKKKMITLFLNFFNYQSVFNTYEKELKNLKIQRRIFYKPISSKNRGKKNTYPVHSSTVEKATFENFPQHGCKTGDDDVCVGSGHHAGIEGSEGSGVSEPMPVTGKKRGRNATSWENPPLPFPKRGGRSIKGKEFQNSVGDMHREFLCTHFCEEKREENKMENKYIFLNDEDLKYNNISIKKKEILNMFINLNRNNFVECSNFLIKIIYFFLNDYSEKDIINIFVTHIKNNNSNYDILLLNKILNIFIYKRKNISLHNNIIICNILAKYQLYYNNFFCMENRNFINEIRDANIHSLVAFIYSLGKLKIKNSNLHFYKLVIKEIIKKIDKINEYGLSCLLYGLNNLIDKKKERELVPSHISEKTKLVKNLLYTYSTNLDSNPISQCTDIFAQIEGSEKYTFFPTTSVRCNIAPEHSNREMGDHPLAEIKDKCGNQDGIDSAGVQKGNLETLGSWSSDNIVERGVNPSDIQKNPDLAEVIKVENELIKAIVKKLIVFKNMNINSFCISISCLSKINIFPSELYEEIKDITYKYINSVNITSLQHLLLALSKFYNKTKKNHYTEIIIFDIYNFLFTYKFMDISFKCACKFLHILSLLNIRDENFVLLLLLVIASEQRILNSSEWNTQNSLHSNKNNSVKLPMQHVHPISGSGKKSGFPTDDFSSNEYFGKSVQNGARCNNSIFKGLAKIKEDTYFKSSYNSYLFFDIKNYKLDLNKLLENFKNVDNSYLINVLESLYNLSYYSYFSIHLSIVIKNILTKQIHDLKVSSIITLLFSYIDLHFFDYSLYDLEMKLFRSEDSSNTSSDIEKGNEDLTLAEDLTPKRKRKSESSSTQIENAPYEDETNEDVEMEKRNLLENEKNTLQKQFNNIYNYMLSHFNELSEDDKIVHIEKLKLIMYELKKNKKYYVDNICNGYDTVSAEYILSMIHDYNAGQKCNLRASQSVHQLNNGRTRYQVSRNKDYNIKRDSSHVPAEKPANMDTSERGGSGGQVGSDSTTCSQEHGRSFVEIKNIVDQFSFVKKFHLKDESLNEKLEKKEYYDDFFFLKYREYYKEDLVNLCLETLLKNSNYIMNNYKQYKNCSIFFLLLFYNIFLPYTRNDIFVYFKCIQRNFTYYKNKSLQNQFDTVLKNIELSDFNYDTIKHVINSKNLSHFVIPYLNILQHNNNFLNKAILLGNNAQKWRTTDTEITGSRYEEEKSRGEREVYEEVVNNVHGEEEAEQTSCPDAYEHFINSYDASYVMKKIKIENLVPLNLLYKFFQLFNFNINNVQLLFLLNEVDKENEFSEKTDDTLKCKKNDISPYNFRNISCPLIQIKNKTLIVHKNSKKIFFKNYNIIDHYFSPSRGLLIQNFDNPVYSIISIYVNAYVVAYRVDILIERNKLRY